MSVSKENVLKIAQLAHIHVPEAQLGTYTDELNHILAHVEALNRLNTDDISPMFSVVTESRILRDDTVVDDGLTFHEQVFAQAPQTDRSEGDFFGVPQVID